MNIDDLQTLAAIATARSFSGAALALGLTQPAISKRIAKLERYYGVSLLERSGKSIHTTESGRALLNANTDISARLEAVKNELDALRSEVTGTLNIIASHHISLHHLPSALKKFYDRHPNVILNISFSDSEIAYQSIASGLADFGIVTLAPKPVEKIHHISLWQDPLTFMAAPKHELTTGFQTLKKLSTERAVLPSMATYTGQLVQDLFNSYNLPLTANMMETNYLETIKMMVSVGLAWSMLPRSMLDGSVQEIPINNISLTRELGIIYRSSYQQTPAAEAFFKILLEDGSAK